MSTLVGLQDIYYAKMTNDSIGGTTTYGTPKKIGHAISVDINPNVETATLYGDNTAVATRAKLKDISITIESDKIPLEDRAIMLGHSIDSVTGAVTVKGDDKAPYVALMFKAQTSEDTEQFYKFYKGKFSPSQQTIETEGESINWQTPSMDGTFIARDSDNKIYDMVDSGSSGAATLVSNWFSQV